MNGWNSLKMSFSQKKIKYVTLKEFNEHLAYCKKYKNIIFGERERFGRPIDANLVIKTINVYLTYRKGLEICTYAIRLDGEGQLQKTTGMKAYAALCRYYKVPNMKDKKIYKREVEEINGKSIVSWNIDSAVPLLYSNPVHQGKEIEKAYEYDLVSAYGWALTQPIPDTTKKPRFYDIVKEGEIGFLADGSITFNSLANVIFPLMESPFKGFVKKWFNEKCSDDKERSAKGKQMLNYSVGYMQRTNPFIRNTIVNRCTMYIESLIDENTLYCNTDSLISLVERKDLNIGSDLGQFQIKHQGQFRYVGYNYQWNGELPIYRGVSKKWFEEFKRRNKRDWNILYDTIPDSAFNQYYFDEKKLKIIKKEY